METSEDRRGWAGGLYLWGISLPARLNGDFDKIGTFADALLNLIPFRINQLQPAVHVLQSDAPSALVHVGLRIVAVLAQEDDFSLVFRDGYVYERRSVAAHTVLEGIFYGCQEYQRCNEQL